MEGRWRVRVCVSVSLNVYLSGSPFLQLNGDLLLLLLIRLFFSVFVSDRIRQEYRTNENIIDLQPCLINILFNEAKNHIFIYYKTRYIVYFYGTCSALSGNCIVEVCIICRVTCLFTVSSCHRRDAISIYINLQGIKQRLQYTYSVLK